MDVVAADRDVGSSRAAAAICGMTHKTVRWVIEAHEAANTGTAAVPRNYEEVADLVARKPTRTPSTST